MRARSKESTVKDAIDFGRLTQPHSGTAFGELQGARRRDVGWMTGFLLAISFVGLLNLLPLRKVPPLSIFTNCLELMEH